MGALVNNAVFQLALVAVGIWAFLKFCTFAKKFSLPGKLKMWTYIITGLCVVFLNWLFSSAKKGLGGEFIVTNPKLMGITILASMVVVLIFSFALMSETKS